MIIKSWKIYLVVLVCIVLRDKEYIKLWLPYSGFRALWNPKDFPKNFYVLGHQKCCIIYTCVLYVYIWNTDVYVIQCIYKCTYL